MSGPDQMLGQMVLGRYRIVHGLARGGMGEIYLARSEGAAGFAKPVVVKRILAEYQTDDTVVQMFKREAKIMSNLHHPGIVSVLDFGLEDGSYFMVLEYVHGLHAGRWRKFLQTTKQVFPAEHAVQIALNVLDALHYAHTLKDQEGRDLHIVHRDVSPSNVLVDVDGHVKLADFGIARMQASEMEWKTQDLSVKGKFPYLPPEVLSGEKADLRTDVYATAVVLHELIAGANEFRAESASQTIGKVINLVPRRLDAIRNDVPTAVADAVAKALSKKAGDRYQNAAEFSAALRLARRSTADEAVANLAAAAKKDFNDPRVPQLLGVDELSTLERAWRNPTVVAVPPKPPLAAVPTPVGLQRPSLAPGEPVGQGVAPAASAEAKSTRYLLLLVGLISLAGVGVGVFAILSSKNTTPTAVYVDQHTADDSPTEAPAIEGAQQPPQQNPTQDVAAANPPPNTAPTANPTTVVAAQNPSAPHVAPQHTAPKAPLEEPFKRRAAEIQHCVSSNVQNIEGSPHLTVRFELDTSGSVQSATLDPAELTATPLGACVLAIAKSTHFLPQEGPVAFRVPLTLAGAQH